MATFSESHLQTDKRPHLTGVLTNQGGVILYEYPNPPGGGIKVMIMKQDESIKRLKNIEGHVRGIQRMLEDGEYCIDVMQQIQAVQAALNKVNKMVLEDHMNSCLITAIRGEDPAERERVLKEIADVYEAATKV